jgi:hypothetical protein
MILGTEFSWMSRGKVPFKFHEVLLEIVELLDDR